MCITWPDHHHCDWSSRHQSAVWGSEGSIVNLSSYFQDSAYLANGKRVGKHLLIWVWQNELVWSTRSVSEISCDFWIQLLSSYIILTYIIFVVSLLCILPCVILIEKLNCMICPTYPIEWVTLCYWSHGAMVLFLTERIYYMSHYSQFCAS
jgi:hypothetical protein